jgi:hypothetical protein
MPRCRQSVCCAMPEPTNSERRGACGAHARLLPAAPQPPYPPPAAEGTPATPVSENSEIVDLLLAEFMRHLPNHKTFSTPKTAREEPRDS